MAELSVRGRDDEEACPCAVVYVAGRGKRERESVEIR